MNCSVAMTSTLGGGGLLVLALCAAIALVVFGVMIHSILTFHGLDAKALAHRPQIEALWALIPMLILFGTAISAVRELGFGGMCS